MSAKKSNTAAAVATAAPVGGSSSSSSVGHDGAVADPSAFLLHLAFASEPASTLQPPLMRTRSTGVAASYGSPPTLALKESSPEAMGVGQAHAAAAAVAAGAATIAHQPSFGFIAFPVALPASAGPAATTAAAISASRATLAQVRTLLPALFPPQHVASLVAADVLTAAQARALQGGSYYFMCTQTATHNGSAASSSSSSSSSVSHSPPASAPIFLPVSPVQEDHVLARNCQPVLVLKPMRNATTTPGVLGGAAATDSAALDSYGKDFLPGSAVNSARRPSCDFPHRELSHQDSMALLESGAGRVMGGGGGGGGHGGGVMGSPNPLVRSVSARPSRPAVSVNVSTEEKHGGGDSRATGSVPAQRDSALGPPSPRRSVSTGGRDSTYKALAESWPVHFDDVIRERTSGLALGGDGSPSPLSSVPRMRITVTGELVDQAPRSDNKRALGRSARRSTNNMVAESEETDDDKEGSVKVFTDMNEFLRDEERRRDKYDAAAAAHAAAAFPALALVEEDTASAADSPAGSDFSGGVTGGGGGSASGATKPPSPAATREPLSQTPLWISLEDGDDHVIETVGRYFGLHPLTIEDCQSKGIREKLEVFPEYLFLVFHALEENVASGGRGSRGGSRTGHGSSGVASSSLHSLQAAESEIMRTTPLKLVVFPSLVLSFHKGTLPSVVTVRRQLDKLYHNRVLNTAWLIHGLLDVVSDSLMPVVDRAAKEADDMEDLIYIITPGRAFHKDVLRRMGAIARRLTFLRQRLWSKRDILTSLIEKDWQFFLTGVKVPYLRDIYDHLVIMLHKLDAAIEVIVTLQGTYLAVVSIDVAAVANDGNKAMKTLSAAATILLPLSLIASLMGMNVMVPFQFDAERITFMDLLPFTTICICMLFISTTLYSYFKKQKYL